MIKRVDNGGQVHLVTNIRKPRKWRRYEYLESSGTLWIDTGVALSLTDKFEFETDFTYSPANNRACPFYGTENYLTGFMAQYHYTSNTLYVVYIKGARFGGSNASITASSRMYSKTVIDVPNKTWATIYNTTSANGTYSNLITDTTSTVKFFGSDLYDKYVAKCYYFKIKINDTLVRDFVPAQYNGQYGMWDLVEDKFYPNKGTGTFIVGSEIKNYDEIDEVRRAGSILPAGVELYDYILSSGTLYIDTGYVPNNTSGIYLRAYCTTSGGNYLIIGCRQTSGDTRWWINYSTTLELSWNLWTGTLTGYTNTWTEVEHNYMNSRSAKVNGTAYSVSYPTLANITYPAYLFNACNQGNLGTGFTGRISNAKITEGTTIVRNFLPCTYLGEPGMWDTVENKFYRNQGTGLFTLGNKITLKEYEYLLMQGTYINTGITPNLDTRILAELLLYDQAQTAVFGSRVTSNSDARSFMVWNGTNDGFAFLYGHNTWNLGKFAIAPTANTRFTIDLNKNVGTLSTGSTKIYNYHTFSSNCPLVIGSTNTSGTIDNRYTKENIYYFKMYSNGKLVRDFIPVSYNGTPGLWDKVEWKFYGNAGSGSFTLGPEKKSGSIYLHSHLTNLFDGFVAGGLMTLSNGILVGTGNNSDTYFKTKTTQAVNTTSYYLVGVYVEGYTSATAWTFCSPQSNSNATLKITRDGWNWGYVKFGNADSLPIWDDANRAFSGPVPKITISDCRIYKIT